MAMFLACRRFLSVKPEVTQAVSNVKWKLQQYQDAGQLHRLSIKEIKRKRDRTEKLTIGSSLQNGISPQKTLILLKSRYDGTVILDDLGNVIDLHSLAPNQLRINDPKLLQLFKGLMQIKRIQKRRIDDRIIMSLTGVTQGLLRDSYFVARDVLHLLEQDNDISRAMEVCRLARDAGSVGINAILEWCLKRSKKDLARKVLVNRGRWGIPLSPATLVTYFSGLSDCHEWGLVKDGLAREVMQQFKENKVARNIETFNAALKLLMKNYNDDQAFAWSFFDELGTIKLRPDAQTFTIFLQGLKSLYKKKNQDIQKNSLILLPERTRKLFEHQAILVLRANMVLEKALVFAVPPKHPSEDEVNDDPQLLVEYKKVSRNLVLNIDRHFAVAFVLCYCDALAGTSWSNKSGSHYWYIQQALIYLQAWMPEVTDFIKFILASPHSFDKVSSTEGKNLILVKPDSEIERKTDIRVKRANVPDEFLPQNVAHTKSMEELNPWASFPTSPFAHRRDKHFFTGIERQLVDFARIKTADLHKEYLENRERRRKKHAGSPLPVKKRTSLKRDKQGINKFLLRIFLDCLLRLGLYDEFYKAMWLSILVWGGIKIDHAKLRDGTPLRVRAINEGMYPVIVSLSPSLGNTGFCQLEAQLDVIDIGLVEDFFYKIEEHFPRSLNPTAFALEVLATFSNRRINMERELRPRPSTFNAIFAMLNRDIYRYNDRNLTLGYIENKRKNLANNTAKLSLTYNQLMELLDSLDILVRSIFARFGGKSMDSTFLQSYNNLVLRIYLVTWEGAPDNHQNAAAVHKKLVRTGILMYRPDHLIDRRQDHTFSRLIVDSLHFVHDKLHDRKDLLEEEIDLMMNLRNLFRFEKNKDESDVNFETLQMRIYQLTK